MATIHKRKLRSGRIVWELTHGTGSDRQRFIAGQTKEEAEGVLKQFEQQLTLHGHAPANDDLDSALASYTSYLKTNRRLGTQRRYLRVLRTFHHCYLRSYQPQIRSLRQLRPAHLEDYKSKRLEGAIAESADPDVEQREAKLRSEAATRPSASKRQDNARFGWLGRKRLRQTVTAKTVNYELQALKTYFHWAIRRNLLFINPASMVERLRIPRKALPKFLTSDQLQRLFAACNERERRLFMTILLSGMRLGEVMHLTWTDVNFELEVILIQAKPQWDWKPKSDERIIPMSAALRTVLEEQCRHRQDGALVFPNKEGGRDIHILPKLKRIARKASIPHATVHALRHSFGAHLRMAGVSLADIGDLLGHKDLATTQIYAKVLQEHLRQALTKLSPLIPGTDPTPKTLASEHPSSSDDDGS